MKPTAAGGGLASGRRCRRKEGGSRRLVAPAVLLGLPLFACVQLAEQPEPEETLAAPRFESPVSDVMGYPVSRAEADALLATAAGRAALAPDSGAVPIDEETLRLGEEAFYEETFGNEVFLTDIDGAFEGPLSVPAIAAAIARPWELMRRALA